jgi:hypothetical protein
MITNEVDIYIKIIASHTIYNYNTTSSVMVERHIQAPANVRVWKLEPNSKNLMSPDAYLVDLLFKWKLFHEIVN